MPNPNCDSVTRQTDARATLLAMSLRDDLLRDERETLFAAVDVLEGATHRDTQR